MDTGHDLVFDNGVTRKTALTDSELHRLNIQVAALQEIRLADE